MQFIWIDDNPSREEAADSLKGVLNVDMNFVDVKDKDLEAEITGLVAGNEPALIIIDHNLEESHTGVFRKGSSVAASIRETWPECPIVCVSAHDPQLVDSQQKALYEDIIEDSRISQNYSKIKSIAESFNKIRNTRPSNTAELMDLIDVPEIDQQKIASILPAHNFKDSSLAVSISRWVRKILLGRPGFLYNKLWVCTLIGIKIESFSKVEHLFADALYRGVFANSEGDRWWKSTVLQILYATTQSSGLPWEAGRNLPNINDGDYSVSHATNRPYPETVAFEDSSTTASEIPIRIQESELHPEYESLLYFDDIRIMKPEE